MSQKKEISKKMCTALVPLMQQRFAGDGEGKNTASRPCEISYEILEIKGTSGRGGQFLLLPGQAIHSGPNTTWRLAPPASLDKHGESISVGPALCPEFFPPLN